MTKILLLSQRRRIEDLLDELEDKHIEGYWNRSETQIEFTEIIDEIRNELN